MCHASRLTWLFGKLQNTTNFGVSNSGLSLVLKKEGLWLTKMDAQPERTLMWATHCRQELIHTSCRSESSNISLVILDKDPIRPLGLSIFHTNPEHSSKTIIVKSMEIQSKNQNFASVLRWVSQPGILNQLRQSSNWPVQLTNTTNVRSPTPSYKWSHLCFECETTPDRTDCKSGDLPNQTPFEMSSLHQNFKGSLPEGKLKEK